MENRGNPKRIELEDFGGKYRVDIGSEIGDHLGFSSASNGSGNIIDDVNKLKNLNSERFDKLSVDLIPGSEEGTYVDFKSNDRVGSLPIKSLSTRKADTAISVKPRFGWNEISSTLEMLQWKVPIEFYPNLESVTGLSKIPVWTLAGEVLRSIEEALKRPAIDHKYDKKTQSEPKGKVDWAEYSRKQFPHGQKHKLPCRYPKLSMNSPAHRYFKGITQYLRDELSSSKDISSSKERKMADSILIKLKDIPSEFPNLENIKNLPERGPWKRYQEAYERCKWVIHCRGLGSGSTGYGIPWSIAMDDLYERWVIEGISRWANSKGGNIFSTSVGSSSIQKISWSTYHGSLKSLQPDVIAKIGKEAIIFDAKYKRHFQILHWQGWEQMKKNYQNEAKNHRADIHQVLGYSAAVKKNEFCFLVYPVNPKWYINEYDSSLTPVGEIGRETKLGLIPLPLGGKKILSMFHKVLDQIYENK